MKKITCKATVFVKPLKIFFHIVLSSKMSHKKC